MDKVDISSVDLQTKLVAQDILTKSSSQPIYLSSIEVTGGETFSNDFFLKLLAPLTETSDYTFGKLVKNVEKSYTRLKDTSVFNDIKVSLSTDYALAFPLDVKNYNIDKTIPTKIKFDVIANNLNIGEYGLNLNNDTPLNVTLNYLNNNFNSNAELINMGVDYNPYKPNQHLITNGKLITNLNNPRFKFLIDLFNLNQNNQIWQQSSEKSIGGLIGLQYNNNSNMNFLTGLSIIKRTLHDINDTAIDDLKNFAGEYLKSSIVNQLNYRNAKFQYLNNITKTFPINGININIANEISSNQESINPSNSNMFIKSVISSDFFKSFWNNNITFKISNDVGLIHDAKDFFNDAADTSEDVRSSTPIHTSDRFYLGGSDSFRGFSKNSVNFNGGNQLFKLDTQMLIKLPPFLYTPHTPLKNLEDGYGYEPNPLRLYTNGIIGNVSNDLLNDKSYCSSLGFGIKYFNNWANFDLGYYVSKRFNNETSGIKDGFQFAFSIGGSNRYL